MDVIVKSLVEAQEMIHIFLVLTLVDLCLKWLNSRINKTCSKGESLLDIWAKLGNVILVVLSGVVDFILSNCGIHFEFALVQMFTGLLIFLEIESIISHFSRSQASQLLKKILDKAIGQIGNKF